MLPSNCSAVNPLDFTQPALGVTKLVNVPLVRPVHSFSRSPCWLIWLGHQAAAQPTQSAGNLSLGVNGVMLLDAMSGTVACLGWVVIPAFSRASLGRASLGVGPGVNRRNRG